MTRLVLNISLLVALVLVVGATFMTQGVPTQRNYEVLPGMFYSVPIDPQSDPLPWQPGNEPLNAVEGTISRDAMIFPLSTIAADSALPASLLSNPFTAEDADAMSRGNKVFDVYCALCHGSSGNGDGLIVTRGYPPPPKLNSEKILSLSDAEMFLAITQGKGNMPSYNSQVNDADRWKSILHVRKLQLASMEEEKK
jgi:mono/diheme cytochrome c family protein